jgi:hypothetical protein
MIHYFTPKCKDNQSCVTLYRNLILLYIVQMLHFRKNLRYFDKFLEKIIFSIYDLTIYSIFLDVSIQYVVYFAWKKYLEVEN